MFATIVRVHERTREHFAYKDCNLIIFSSSEIVFV